MHKCRSKAGGTLRESAYKSADHKFKNQLEHKRGDERSQNRYRKRQGVKAVEALRRLVKKGKRFHTACENQVARDLGIIFIIVRYARVWKYL